MSAFLASAAARFADLEDRLNTLDAATGDGDHGATMLKGLRASAADPEAPEKAFRRAAGGASGSLFGVLVGALCAAESGAEGLPDALARAAERIAALGGAKPGDKTMLDALLPAAMGATAPEAAARAREGAEATVPMVAKRGRARHVEGAGAGHMDAGALSVAELLATLAGQEGR